MNTKKKFHNYNSSYGRHIRKPDKPSDDITSRKMIYDFFFHEADKISQRTDWFLIFHAILIEAFNGNKGIISELIIGLFGTLIGFIWFMTGIRGWWLLWQLGEKMEEQPDIGNNYKKIFDERDHMSPWYSWAGTSPVFSIIVPAISVMVWLLLSILNLSGYYKIIYIVSIVGLIIITLLVRLCIIKRPRSAKSLTS